VTTKARPDADRTAKPSLADHVRAAAKAIGMDVSALREDEEGRVWLGSSHLNPEGGCVTLVRARAPHLNCGAHATRARFVSAVPLLIREWVREQLDAWVSDDGDGE